MTGIAAENLLSETSKVLLGLSDEQRAAVGSFFGAVAAKPGALGEDFIEAIGRARAICKDRTYQRMLDWMLICTPKVESLPDVQASSTIRQWAQRFETAFAEGGGAMSGGVAPVAAPRVCELVWADDAEIQRRIATFADEFPDFHGTMKSYHRPIPGHINGAYFRTSARAAEIFYYLAKHPTILADIVAAPPIEAGARLFALERELDEWRWRCLIRMLTPEELYSLELPAAPTAEESLAARRLLHLVALLADPKTAN